MNTPGMVMPVTYALSAEPCNSRASEKVNPFLVDIECPACGAPSMECDGRVVEHIECLTCHTRYCARKTKL